jgi:glyoxylase-like metal-dependent hydrolase (beta-lactamase superfamily II)
MSHNALLAKLTTASILLLSTALLPLMSASVHADSITQAPFRISLIHTAQSTGTPEALVVEGGSWTKVRKLLHGSLLIEHPKGNLLFDTGLGRQIDEAFAYNSWWQRELFAYENVNPALDQMLAQGLNEQHVSAIILSHLHWDHTGGLPDFPNTPVWVQPQGLDQAQHRAHRPTFLPELLENAHWSELALSQQEYLGFEQTLDIYQDRRLILVDLSGHSEGQVGLFVNLDSGRQFFFIGDCSWVIEGIKENKPRPSIVDFISPVDWSREMNDDVIEKIHNLSLKNPALVIVPAHDEIVAQQIAQFPQYEH